MALSEPRVFHPRRLPPQEEQQVAFSFDRVSDTFMLMVGPLASQRVAVSVPISDFEYIRVDANTEEITGLHVEDFLTHAVYVNPVYLDFAGLIEEVAPEELAQIRRAAAERQAQMNLQERQQELLAVMLGGLRQRIDVA